MRAPRAPAHSARIPAGHLERAALVSSCSSLATPDSSFLVDCPPPGLLAPRRRAPNILPLRPLTVRTSLGGDHHASLLARIRRSAVACSLSSPRRRLGGRRDHPCGAGRPEARPAPGVSHGLPIDHDRRRRGPLALGVGHGANGPAPPPSPVRREHPPSL